VSDPRFAVQRCRTSMFDDLLPRAARMEIRRLLRGKERENWGAGERFGEFSADASEFLPLLMSSKS
jgi:hypothetical protein